MESKKINQLATEMAPASTDLTIIGDPITGVSKKITLEQIASLFAGSVSFYTNYASFPATGNIDTIYCAKDTNKLYLWNGAYVEIFPSQALLDTYQLRSEKGNANGYASLDSTGKVPITQLPSSIMEYKGTWNASTNTPTLANGTGDTGDVYICSVAGTVNFGAGSITFAVGDYVIYSGTIWQRSSGAVGTVSSVAVTESGDALTITGSPITTSGTINIGFAGSSAQYVAGDGSLVTFPTVVTQAQNLVTEVYNETGATLTKGTIVYINGGHGNLPTITKAIATGDSTSAQTYGVVRTDITNNNNGYVTVFGNIDNIDTQAYTAGTQLYLSSTTAGAWTSTKQYAPAHLVYVGIVTRSHPTQGVVEIRIQNGFELEELHNVSAQSPSNNDGIFYNTSTSLWEKKSIATALGYTPANDSLVVHLAGTETITGTKFFNTPIALDNALNLKFDASINAFGGYYSLYAIKGSGSANSVLALYDGDTNKKSSLTFDNTNNFTYTFPSASGTLALTSNLSAYVPYTGATADVDLGAYNLKANSFNIPSAGSTNQLTSFANTSNLFSGSVGLNVFGFNVSNNIYFGKGATNGGVILWNNSQVRYYTLPDADGTLALTSNLSAYLPLSGGTLTGALNGTSIALTGTAGDSLLINHSVTRGIRVASSGSGYGIIINNATGATSIPFVIQQNGSNTITLNANGSAEFTSALIGTAATFSGALLVSNATDTYPIFQTSAADADVLLGFSNTGDGNNGWGIGRRNTGEFWIANYTGNFLSGTRTIPFQLASTGAATFSSNIYSSGGDLGIGTTSPETFAGYRTAEISATAGGIVFAKSTTGGITTQLVADNGTTSGYVGTRTNHAFSIRTNNSDKVTITSAGNVGIGTSTFNGNNLLQVAGRVDVNLDQGAFRLFNGSNTFIGGIGTGAWVDGTSTTDIGLYSINTLRFYSGGSSSERMRITSGGNVLIGSTTDSGAKLQVSGSFNIVRNIGDTIGGFSNNSSGGYGIVITAGNGGQFNLLCQDYAGNNRFFVTGAGNLYATNTTISPISSDVNLKTDIKNYDKGLAEVLAMKPRYYKYKDNLKEEKAGFIAQEMDEAIEGSMIDGIANKNGEVYKTYNVDWYPLLVKAIQEQQQQIEELKLKIK